MATADACLGDEVGVLRITRIAPTVTGEYCERPNKDCYPLRDGLLAAGRLTFVFGEDPGMRCTGDVTLAGATLTDALFCTKRSCTMPKTLHRL